MSLPKIKVPLFDAVIPSTKENIKFRPFLVKEEKILLIAQAGGSKKEMINGLKQVIGNCITKLDGTEVNIDALTTFDVEYLFLTLRAKSVDNIVTVKYIDNEDEKTYEFKINLDKLEIQYNPEHTKKIKINSELSMEMKYPTIDALSDAGDDVAENVTATADMIKKCIGKVFDKDNVYETKDSTPEEMDEFVSALPLNVFADIEKFFDTMPRLYHKIEYKNTKGTARVIELTTLDDFFTLD